MTTEAVNAAAAPELRPFTTEEYVRIRELGGHAVNEIVAMDPFSQAEHFCEVAVNEFELGGDPSFVRRNLDAGWQAAERIEKNKYTERDGASVDDCYDVIAYLKIAEDEQATQQTPERVQKALEAARLKVETYGEHPTRSAALLFAVIETAHKLDTDQEQVISLFDQLRSILRANPAAGIRLGMAQAAELSGKCGLDSDYIDTTIKEARATAKEAETVQDRVSALMKIAKTKIQNFELSPGFRLAVLEDARQQIIKAAGEEDEDPSQRVDRLIRLAEAAHAIEQPEKLDARVTKTMVVQGTQEALKAGEEDPYLAIRLLRQLVSASIELQMHDSNDDLVVQPAIDFIKSTSLPEREKHKLLNHLLNGLGSFKDLLTRNGVEQKPLSFVFKAS